MNNIAWLNRGYEITKEIRRLERAKAEALEEAVCSSSPGGPVVSGGDVNARESRVIAYTQLAEDYERERDRLSKVKLEIERAILSMPEGKDRLILQYRFLDFMPIDQIREKVGHTEYNSTQRAIKRAAAKVKIPKKAKKKESI